MRYPVFDSVPEVGLVAERGVVRYSRQRSETEKKQLSRQRIRADLRAVQKYGEEDTASVAEGATARLA